MNEILKYIKISARAIGVMILAGALFFGWHFINLRKADDEAKFIFLDMPGKADCSILLSESSCVMIDTGNAEGREDLFRVLEENQVDKIDCLILSSPLSAHIGGAEDLLDHIKVVQILVPYYEGELDSYKSLRDKAESMQIPVYQIYRHRLFTYGELDIRVFAPEKFYYDNQKNYALTVHAKHGEVSTLFVQGAGDERTRELLNLPMEPLNLLRLSLTVKEENRNVLKDKLLSGMVIEELKGDRIFISDAAGFEEWKAGESGAELKNP